MRYLHAGENEFYRWGKKAQEKALAYAESNKNGWVSIPVYRDKYWNFGTSVSKYGQFAKIHDTCFSVNSIGCIYAKVGTEKCEKLVAFIHELVDDMKKMNEER